MSLFTPVPGLIGGSIIGLAASILLLLNGDVMGSSGIISPLLLHPRKTWQSQIWKFVFTASFIGAANIYNHVAGNALDGGDAPPRTPSTIGWIVAGLFVGFGTKLANGCTSGHGICGLARFSKRSFAAVCTFMGVAVTTAVLLSQAWIQPFVTLLHSTTTVDVSGDPKIAIAAATIPTIFALGSLRHRKTIGAAISGSLFAVGLAVSKMVLPAKVMGFLDVSAIARGTYDPTLITVMGSGVVVSYLSYFMKNRREKPLFAEEFIVPTNPSIDMTLLAGSSFFGLGWGLAGLCPGPALYWAASGVPNASLTWLPAYVLGAFCAEELKAWQAAAASPEAAGKTPERKTPIVAVADKPKRGSILFLF